MAGICLLTALVPWIAQATCSASTLSGKYQLYLMGSESDGAIGTITCPVRVRASGNVDAANCGERNIVDGRFTSRLTGGNLAIAASCRVSGRLRVREDGETVTLTIDNAWLTGSGEVLAGVGRVSGTSALQFTAIRK
jgi:hypothetical protein